MKKKGIVFFLSALLAVGCSSQNASYLGTVTPNPNGTKEEQIEYHKNEIRKYRSAVEREEQNSRRHLSQRKMSDVRQSNNRRDQYLNQIDKHARALQKLKGGGK